MDPDENMVKLLLGLFAPVFIGFQAWVVKMVLANSKALQHTVDKNTVKTMIRDELVPLKDQNREILLKLDAINSSVQQIAIKTAVLQAIDERGRRSDD